MNCTSLYKFSVHLFVCYIVTIVIICTLWYTIANQNSTSPGNMFTTCVFSIFLFTLLLISIFPLYINTTVHSVHDDLFGLDTRRFSEKGLLQLNMFRAQTQGSTVGLTCCGLLLLDKAAVLSVCGTILTYAILVYQFNTSDMTPVCRQLWMELNNQTSACL